MKRKKIGASLALVLLAAGLYYAPAFRDKAPFALDLRESESFHYQLEYTSEGHGQLQKRLPRSQNLIQLPDSRIHVQLEAPLRFDVLQKTSEGYRLRFTIQPRTWVYEMPQGQSIQGPEQVSGILAISRSGRIEEFHLSEAQYQHYGFIVADILSLLEFDVGSGLSEWNAVERSFQGEVPVRYQRIDGTSQAITLHKSYESLPAMTLSGGMDYSITARTFYQTIKGERRRQYRDGHGTEMRDTTRLTLKPSSEKIASSSRPEPVLDTRETLRGTNYQKKIAQAIAIRRVGQKTAADVKAELEALGDNEPQKKADVYMLLRSYLYLHPEAIEEFSSYLVDLPYSHQACRTLAAVLSDLGSAEAQRALMKAIDQALDTNQKEKMIAHLGFVEKLKEDAENKLYEIAGSEGPERVKGAAELAVGVVGGQHLAQGHQAGVERALQMGEARLKESASPADQQHALRILGNIGAPQQLGLIKPYLNAAEPSTKREAIRALRAVESVEAYGILLDILKNDNSDVMRHAAIESLSSKAQSAEIYEYLKNQLFVEKDERVIQRIVSHLVNMRGTYPEVRKILEQYLEQCGKTSVCGFASSALASM